MNTTCIHFSDFFDIDPGCLDDYGAFNVSLINDLPLFIDPFLLFNSENPVYRDLHDHVIGYLRHLRERSAAGWMPSGLLRSLYCFPEVRQNWLGFSEVGNSGTGLGMRFATALHEHLQSVFASFGEEQITQASHLEKLCLVGSGVGRDNISDFTTNLIKGFLLKYTQEFAKQFLSSGQCGHFAVDRVAFNYQTGTWMHGRFFLPEFRGEYVLLTPRDMLTRDETWINQSDMIARIEEIAQALPDEVLRAHFNDYLSAQLAGFVGTEKEKREEKQRVLHDAILRYPEIVDYYIRHKEDTGEEAVAHSNELVQETETLFVTQLREFANTYLVDSPFYRVSGNTFDEARQRVLYLKQVIENNDGYRLFYPGGKPIRRERDLHILFRLTWYGTTSDLNSEVNNGRGSVDFNASRGSADKSLVEFKLASNPKLRQNLQNQVPIYEAANQTQQSLKVIVYLTEYEEQRVIGILRELGQENNGNIILIDARDDNKPSASIA